MPKIKKNVNKVNDENLCPMKTNSSKNASKSRSPFKFDVKQILKERKAYNEYWERSAELDKQLEVVDVLFQKEVNQIITCTTSFNLPNVSESGFVVFDSSKYDIVFKNNSNLDVTNSYLQQLYQMSIEENELEANIYFYNLMQSNWLPVFDDIQNILINWGTDVDTLLNKPLLKCPINDEGKIKHHSIELVIRFITQCIQKSDKNYSVDDLLTLAKFAATISFDHNYGQTKIIFKKLFCTCIEIAFHDDDDTAILSFCQELYSKYRESQLFNMVVDLFLPLEGQTMKKIYTYLSYKLFKTFLGLTNNVNAFPSNTNDWFVQDLVNVNYFRLKPKRILNSLIQLLEHVVVVLDLYKNEEKLSNMCDFLRGIVKPVGLSLASQDIVHILDQWRMHLFRLHVDRKKMIV